MKCYVRSNSDRSAATKEVFILKVGFVILSTVFAYANIRY